MVIEVESKCARLQVALGVPRAAQVEAVAAVLVQAAQRRAALIAVLAPDFASAPDGLWDRLQQSKKKCLRPRSQSRRRLNPPEQVRRKFLQTCYTLCNAPSSSVKIGTSVTASRSHTVSTVHFRMPYSNPGSRADA